MSFGLTWLLQSAVILVKLKSYPNIAAERSSTRLCYIFCTPKYMTECPHVVMYISGLQLLARRLQREILQHGVTKSRWHHDTGKWVVAEKTWKFWCLLTREGNIFSAARRGTEKPPCVLVSLAVSVLQKNSICGLACLSASSDSCNASFAYW